MASQASSPTEIQDTEALLDEAELHLREGRLDQAQNLFHRTAEAAH